MDNISSCRTSKTILRKWVIEKAFAGLDTHKRQIADKFGGQFIYKETFYYGSKLQGLSLHLPTDMHEEFEPYHQEIMKLERDKVMIQNHLTNYFNQCRTVADLLKIFPDYVVDMMKEDMRLPPVTLVTVSPDLVRQYQEHEYFQCLLDRIIILGDF